MAREELKWQNIDADDLPAAVKKSSDAIIEQRPRHRNQNTDDERNNPVPTGLDLFQSAPSCAAQIPNQNRTLSMAVSAVIGAALWRPYYAYGYGELPHSASAKSPNPDQGYLALRHHER